MKRISIDINCDVGEGNENEEKLFPLISSCNIACGGHAGDAKTMLETVKLAKLFQVNIGAHPSYPDMENFGRVSVAMQPEDLVQSVRQQIKGLEVILEKENVNLHHIKPHGALYNDIAKERNLAQVFLRSIMVYRKDVFLYVPYASEIEKEALNMDFRIKYEAFADRNYTDDLRLVSRKHLKALLDTPHNVLMHVVQMAMDNKVITISGKVKKILADTFCIHSDTLSAFEIVSYLNQKLPDYNIHIKK